MITFQRRAPTRKAAKEGKAIPSGSWRAERPVAGATACPAAREPAGEEEKKEELGERGAGDAQEEHVASPAPYPADPGAKAARSAVKAQARG
eukprot:5763506-Alexandrium_andersonii.AAC.1